jgi:hypothetical protein
MPWPSTDCTLARCHEFHKDRVESLGFFSEDNDLHQYKIRTNFLIIAKEAIKIQRNNFFLLKLVVFTGPWYRGIHRFADGPVPLGRRRGGEMQRRPPCAACLHLTPDVRSRPACACLNRGPRAASLRFGLKVFSARACTFALLLSLPRSLAPSCPGSRSCARSLPLWSRVHLFLSAYASMYSCVVR